MILFMQLNTLFRSTKTTANLAEYFKALREETACDVEFRIEGKRLEMELRQRLCLAYERSWVRAPENTGLGRQKRLYTIKFTESIINTNRLRLRHRRCTPAEDIRL